MQVAYELTKNDFTDAYSVHRNRSPWRKWFRRIVFWICAASAAIILFGFSLKPSAQAARDLAPFFGLLLMWYIILSVLPKWLMNRQFTNQPGAHGPRTVLFDPAGAHWRWNGGSSDIEWKNYIKFVEGKDQFLVYTSPACFNIVPKRALAKEELVEFRNLLTQYVRIPAKHSRHKNKD